MTSLAARRTARSERPLFVAAALAPATVVFLGFARTFYLKGLFGGRRCPACCCCTAW